MGESRKAATAKRRSHDRRTLVIAGLRQTRQLENQIIEVEKDMALRAKGFARAPARKREPTSKITSSACSPIDSRTATSARSAMPFTWSMPRTLAAPAS